ncbi:hypothetical protein ACTJKH_08820 [Microbacterium sp. 22215]|uniref:hypothetical protein n=1 Tax=Microbacterium sp. 22215 TaxID=3453893 RepID=UPI003F82EA20
MDDLAIALTAGDPTGVHAVLHHDVTLIVDSGGRMPQSSAPVDGRAAASAALAALMTPETTTTTTSINGVPGFVLTRQGSVVAAVTAEARSSLLSRIWIVCNPEKLRHWNRRIDG